MSTADIRKTDEIEFDPYRLVVTTWADISNDTGPENVVVVMTLHQSYTETEEREYGMILTKTREVDCERSRPLVKGRGEAATVGGAFSMAEEDLHETMEEEMEDKQRKEGVEERIDACLGTINIDRISEKADDFVDDQY